MLSRSEEETRALAASLATHLHDGDIVALTGPLGAGKTAFAQALCRALGVEGPITSPTYALVNRYTVGERVVLHADLYRIADEDELEALGLWDDIHDGAIAVIEWAERAPSLVAAARYHVTLEDLGPTSRRIAVNAIQG